MFSKLLSFLILLIIISGCGNSTTVKKIEKKSKILNMALSTDPTTLDPALCVDVISGSLVSKIFRGIVKFNEKMEIVSDLVEKYSITENGKCYNFKLKKGIKFSNGDEVTSSDILNSIKRVLSPDSLSQRKWIFKNIVGIKAFENGKSKEISGIKLIDKYSFKIELNKSSSNFLSLLAMPNSYIVKEEKKQLSGCGAYKLIEFKRGSYIKLRKNPYYNGSDLKLDGIDYKIIKNNMSIWASFSSGNLDIFNIPAELLPEFINSKDFKEKYNLMKVSKLNTYYICMNCKKIPFNNKDIRVAVNYAIDREEIINNLLNNCVEEAEGPIPDTLRSWKFKFPYKFNIEKAKFLLKKNGYDKNNHLKFTLSYKSKAEIGDIMMVIKEQLKKVNIDVSLLPMEWSGLKAKINNGEVEMAYLNWSADYPSPHNFFYPLFFSGNCGSGGNRSFYSSKEFDKMMKMVDDSTSEVEIKKLYSKMEKLVVDDAPWLPLWHEVEYGATQKYVKGYELPKIYTQDRGLNIELKK